MSVCTYLAWPGSDMFPKCYSQNQVNITDSTQPDVCIHTNMLDNTAPMTSRPGGSPACIIR